MASGARVGACTHFAIEASQPPGPGTIVGHNRGMPSLPCVQTVLKGFVRETEAWLFTIAQPNGSSTTVSNHAFATAQCPMMSSGP